MAAPNVQSVEQIISDLNPAYQSSIDVLNAKKAALPGQFQAQRMGLDAEKVQGFNDINNQATSRGMSFSGIPLDEQATYLSTKYLPGQQALIQQQNDQNSTLDQSLAQIDQERRLRALDTQGSQQKSLQDYLAQQQQIQIQQQQFEASQALERAKMAQSASEAAKDRAASASQNVAPTASQALASWASQGGADYKKNFSFENNVLPQLKANYGLSNAEAYQLRKQVLGY